MTRGERTELATLVKMRARVAKDDIGSRQAQLLADVEAQLAAHYSPRHEAWADVTEQAEKMVKSVDADIAARCRELGIPERFRPSINVAWYGRGENADKNRRAELRKVAETRLAASAKAAKVEIDRSTADLLTTLAAGALESSESRGFLESMPSIDALMPRLSLPELEG